MGDVGATAAADDGQLWQLFGEFAVMVTDLAAWAWLCDAFVLPLRQVRIQRPGGPDPLDEPQFS